MMNLRSMKRNSGRNGQTSAWGVVIAILVVIIGIIIGIVFYQRAHISQLGNQEACHSSVIFKTTGKGLGNLDCQTDYVCISGGGTCANMNPTVTIKVDPGNKTQVMKAIAEQLAGCWYTYGEGKLDYGGISQIASGNGLCAVCSVIGFDKSVQEDLLASSVRESESYKLISDNDAYSSLLTKYAMENHPNDMSAGYFKALLISIAYQNNWGASKSGSWIIGYHAGDGTYETPEEQISAVSKILQNAFNNVGGQEGWQEGTTENYAKCDSKNIQDQAACILSVYHTGQINSKRTLLNPFRRTNTEGINYANDVLLNWNSIKDYGPLQELSSSSSSSVSSTQNDPLTFNELMSYLVMTNVTEDNQVQSYLHYLYGYSKVDQLSGFGISSAWLSQPIDLSDQYAIITGEVKNSVFGAFKSQYIHPIPVAVDQVQSIFGNSCTEYLTENQAPQTSSQTGTTTVSSSSTQADISSITSGTILSVMNSVNPDYTTATFGGKNCGCGTQSQCSEIATSIYNSAKSYGEDPFLLLSIMMQESGCNVNAASGTGKGEQVGLMQINSYGDCGYSTLQDLAGAVNYDKNIQCGALILNEKNSLYGPGTGSHLFPSPSTGYTSCSGFSTTYTGWNASVRGYNGYGCGGDNHYVEHVDAIYNAILNSLNQNMNLKWASVINPSSSSQA